MRRSLILLIIIFIHCSEDPVIPVNPPTQNLDFNLLWELSLSPVLPQGIVIDERSGMDYFYVAAKAGGLLIFDNSVSPARQIASIPIAELNGHHAMHIAQEGNFVYLALGDFFVKEAQAGLVIVDISNPDAPKVTDIYEVENIGEGSAIVIVENDYAYLGAMSDGVYVFDVSDKRNIIETDHYIPDVNFPINNPNSIQEPNARGMTIQGNELFVTYDAGGIRVLDVTDKFNLSEKSRYINDTFEKPKAYNNILIDGDYAYVAVDYCGMEILDISDIENIKRTSWCNPWACDSNDNTWFNSGGHANQLVLHESTSTLVLSTGKSEVTLMDVSNPDDCKVIKSYGSADNNEGVWGLTVDDDKIYALYIQALIPFVSNWSGIRCIELVR